MRRVRRGPSIGEFLRYYLLVLLDEEARTKVQLVAAIREKSKDNRAFRRNGALWVAADEMQRSLRQLEAAGLIEASDDGKWHVTRAGRAHRKQCEQQHQAQPDSKQQAADRLIALMASARPGARVLDVGTGEGFLALMLAERGFDVVGIDAAALDYSENCLRNARERAQAEGRRVEFRQADVTELDDEQESFDYVVSSQAIHCMSDHRACVTAIHRLLRPGGWFLGMDFSVGLTGFRAHGFHGFLALSAEEWDEILPECGLEVVCVEGLGDYLIVAARKPG